MSQLPLGDGYCLDANVIIDLCRRHYPRRRFRRLWENIDLLVAQALVVAPEEVLIELERQEGNSAYQWAQSNKRLFIPPDTAQLAVVSALQAAAPKLAAESARRTKPGFGDPFVVALAEVRGWTTVTEEGRGVAQIPSLCALRGVRCINLLGLFDERRWDL